MKTTAMTDARQVLSGILFTALAVGLVGAPSVSFSQVLEEVIVTAQKREESIQDVPISISAMTGDQVNALGLTDFTEITQQIPGLQLNAWSPNLTIFNLRGVSQNNFQDHLEDGVIAFDYRIHPGIVTKSNALELMRAVGLEV